MKKSVMRGIALGCAWMFFAIYDAGIGSREKHI